MATAAEWCRGYARQADADFQTFSALRPLPVPECHKLKYLQMACEKLAKAHLCGEGADPATLQQSHTYVAGTVPVILRQFAPFVKLTGKRAAEVLRHAKYLCQEIEVLAPAVKRGGAGPTTANTPGAMQAGLFISHSIGLLSPRSCWLWPVDGRSSSWFPGPSAGCWKPREPR